MIHFEPEEHRYFDDNGLEYTSVTTLLSEEFPFDQEAIAEKVRHFSSSRYHGMSKERILKYWENSSGHGNVVHNAIEDYIKHKKMPDDINLVPLVEQFAKLKFSGKLLSEELLWDSKYRLAGTADILEDMGDFMYLYDIKTSNKISDDKLMKFSMQLELYKRLGEKVFKKPVIVAAILHFEDYVVRRKNTKLRVIQPLRCGDSVDDILEKRYERLQG